MTTLVAENQRAGSHGASVKAVLSVATAASAFICQRIALAFTATPCPAPGATPTEDDIELLEAKAFIQERLPAAKLKKLAAKRRPPQEWYDEEGKPF